MPKRTLLIDGDVVAYQAAAALEEAVEWDEGYWTWSVSFEEVCMAVRNRVDEYMDKLDGTDYVMALTDPKHNFRLDVLPTYKTHRRTVKKPLVLLHTKDWIIENMNGMLRPALEGDDIMGILATRGKGEKIIVSIDKDMKTIPCTYVRDRDTDPIEITEQYADWWHLMQTLMGDTTDGYKGCPNVGMKRAEEILDLNATIAINWNAVVETYESRGLGEEEALRQARVARILRASDYDFRKKEPILWTPPKT